MKKFSGFYMNNVEDDEDNRKNREGEEEKEKKTRYVWFTVV